MRRRAHRTLVPKSMRACFTKQGDRKAKFSEREARERALRYHQHAYECPQCKGWHLASIEEASRGR